MTICIHGVWPPAFTGMVKGTRKHHSYGVEGEDMVCIVGRAGYGGEEGMGRGNMVCIVGRAGYGGYCGEGRRMWCVVSWFQLICHLAVILYLCSVSTFWFIC